MRKFLTFAAAVFLVAVGTAQTKKTEPKAKPAPPLIVKPAPAPIVVPAPETMDSLKLQLALSREHSLALSFSELQQRAMQQIEPQLGPLRAQYAAQERIVIQEEQLVRKANKFGPDIVLDRNPGSPTFGEWIKVQSPAKTK